MKDGAVLVTGATGFIGRHLVRRLVSDGQDVIALARRPPDLSAMSVTTVVVPGEWTAEAIVKSLAGRRIAEIHHLAAYGVRPGDRDPEEMGFVNEALPMMTVMVAKVFGAAVVAAGSSAEYAPAETGVALDEEAPLEEHSLYGASKATGGTVAHAWAAALGVPFRYLRLFNVFGPGEAAYRLLPSLTAGLAANRRVPLSAGTQVRDFVYVGDAVDAMLAAGGHARAVRPDARIWNVCSGEGRTVRDFALAVAEAMGKPAGLLGFDDLPLRPDETMWLVGDPSRAAAELGWRPRYGLADGIAAALAAMPSRATLDA